MKIKTLLILSSVLFISGNIYAQQKENNLLAIQFQRDFVNDNRLINPSNSKPGLSDYDEEKYQKFKRMRTAGIILSGVGTGLIIAGNAMIQSETNNVDEFFDNELRGIFATVFGIASVGGGVTMWIIGNNKMKKYGGGSVTLKNTKSGVGLVYNF